MLALQESAKAANSGTITGIVIIAVVMALFWRTALKVVLTIAAIAIAVMLISGAVLIVHYADYAHR
jgi:hypothetical protein